MNSVSAPSRARASLMNFAASLVRSVKPRPGVCTVSSDDAMLVELFPTRIRYTSMSLPYHIGNGWFGGLLPATAFAIVASTGDIYAGLWYPVIFASITVVIGFFFLPETKDVDIKAT